MRTLTLLVFFASAAWSQPNLPPKSPQVTIRKGTEATANQKEASKTHDARRGPSTGAENEAEALPKKETTEAKTREELEINRKIAEYTGQLAAFTKLLVFVGIFQFLALIGQGIVFWRTLKENRNLIAATGNSAAAARQAADAAVSSNALTDKSIGESQRSSAAHEALVKESNALTHRTLVLSQRPRIKVRSFILQEPSIQELSVDVPEDEYPFAPVDPIRGEVSVVNWGTGKTVVGANCYRIFHGRPPKRLPMKPPYDTGAVLIAKKQEIQPGQSVQCPFTGVGPSARQLEDAFTPNRNPSIPPGQNLYTYILGWIEYADELGLTRRTAFCQRYDLSLRRFITVDDPDYEYAD